MPTATPKQTLALYGVKTPECSVVNFPTNLHPKLISAWAEFIATDTAVALYNRYPGDQYRGMLEVVTAFISMCLKNVGATIFLQRRIDVARDSADRALPEIASMVETGMITPFTRRGLLREFKPLRVNLVPTYEYDERVQGHVPEYIDVYYSVVLMRGGDGKPRDMGRVLRGHSQHWFQLVSVPAKLLSASPVAALKNAAWPRTVEEVARKPASWIEVVEGISAARIEGNVLVFRQRIYPKTIVYCSRTNVARFFKQAIKMLSP